MSHSSTGTPTVALDYRSAHAHRLESLGPPAIVLAACAVGFAIHIRDGEYTPRAIACVTVALLTTAAAVMLGRPGEAPSDLSRPLLRGTLAAALTAQFFALFVTWPVGVDQATEYLGLPNRLVYLVLVSLAGLLVLLGYLNAAALRRLWFPGLLIVHSLLGVWMVRSSPQPHIDVWIFQQDGPAALLHGRNPYDADQVRFPDIYLSTHEGRQRVYGEGMVVDDRLRFGFPYPPASLYCSTLGYALAGDTRFAQAMALTLAGALIGYARAGQFPKFAAALLMFTPRAFFIIGRAWTEPFVVMFLAGVIFCTCRNLKWFVPVALGVFLASKQYLIFAVPLSFLLVEEFDVRQRASWAAWGKLLSGAIGVAIGATLPMALWNARAFWFSTVTVQQVAPFRWDALSYLVWAGFNLDTKYTTWTWLAFATALLALAACAWRCRRDPAGFALALGAVYLPFIAFNKQAFCNYYFFVIGCLCCAVAALRTGGGGYMVQHPR